MRSQVFLSVIADRHNDILIPQEQILVAFSGKQKGFVYFVEGKDLFFFVIVDFFLYHAVEERSDQKSEAEVDVFYVHGRGVNAAVILPTLIGDNACLLDLILYGARKEVEYSTRLYQSFSVFGIKFSAVSIFSNER